MKKLNDIKFIDLVLYTLISFILLLPIGYVLAPILISMFSHSLNITMTDINAVWQNSIEYTNNNLFSMIQNTAMKDVITNVYIGFGINNTFLSNITTYWILTGSIALIFIIIMKMFTYILNLITPKEKK